MGSAADFCHVISEAAGGARVSLGHDWLTGMRGGERVLEMFCDAFSYAPISSLLYVRGSVSEKISSHAVNTSFLNSMPGIANNYRNFLPIMPVAAETLNVPDCDLFISTSHCVAKSFRKPQGAKHLCVCFTPMRYAWLFYKEYFGRSPAKAAIIKPILAALRMWDKKTSRRVDRYVAISNHVARRIREFYGRDSDVVYPAVDIFRCTPGTDGGNDGYDLIVSALVPYKRVDLAVSLYSRTGMKLKVVGVGGGMKHLKTLAGPSVEFLGRLSDSDVLKLYRGCRMLIFPGEEDYGIVPLEAQACGKPVVAYGRGGVLETVVDGVTGVFFSEQTEECLEDAVARCAALKTDPEAIRNHAVKFGPERFAAGIASSLSSMLNGVTA